MILRIVSSTPTLNDLQFHARYQCAFNSTLSVLGYIEDGAVQVTAFRFDDPTPPTHLSISCQVQGLSEAVDVTLDRSQNGYTISGLPYPSSITHFDLNHGNFLLVATDSADPARVRLFISAELDTASGKYAGELMTDSGGHQIQNDIGPANCSIAVIQAGK